MLISQYRKGNAVNSNIGVRNNKELFFDELSEKEQKTAIFKVLLQDFYVIETERQALLNIWKNIKNIRGRYGAKLRKVWRYENHKNYLSQIKKENNFEQYHNGNLDALKDYVRANYCTFNAKNGGYVSIFKRNHLCLPKVLEKFA